MENCNKEDKSPKQISHAQAWESMEKFLKRINSKDKTAERMGKASIHFTKK